MLMSYPLTRVLNNVQSSVSKLAEYNDMQAMGGLTCTRLLRLLLIHIHQFIAWALVRSWMGASQA